MPQATHDAAGANSKQQGHASNDTNDDTGDGATAKVGAASGCQGAIDVARACGTLQGPRGGGGRAGASDAVGGAELGGDGAAGGGYGGLIRGIGSGPGTSSGARGSCAGIGDALALIGAVLPARTANGTTCYLARASRRRASTAAGGCGGSPVAGNGTCECRCLGPCGGIHGIIAVGSHDKRDGGCTASDIVRSCAHLVCRTAMLVFGTAVCCAAAIFQKAKVEEVVEAVLGERVGKGGSDEGAEDDKKGRYRAFDRSRASACVLCGGVHCAECAKGGGKGEKAVRIASS